MEDSSGGNLTQAQNELYGWIKDYMRDFQHSPSIRQMMQAMGLKSPAPIQSRLKHLQEKGYISWQEGKARTMQIVDEIIEGVPVMGSGAVLVGNVVEKKADHVLCPSVAQGLQNLRISEATNVIFTCAANSRW